MVRVESSASLLPRSYRICTRYSCFCALRLAAGSVIFLKCGRVRLSRRLRSSLGAHLRRCQCGLLPNRRVDRVVKSMLVSLFIAHTQSQSACYAHRLRSLLASLLYSGRSRSHPISLRRADALATYHQLLQRALHATANIARVRYKRRIHSRGARQLSMWRTNYRTRTRRAYGAGLRTAGHTGAIRRAQLRGPPELAHDGASGSTTSV